MSENYSYPINEEVTLEEIHFSEALNRLDDDRSLFFRQSNTSAVIGFEDGILKHYWKNNTGKLRSEPFVVTFDSFESPWRLAVKVLQENQVFDYLRDGLPVFLYNERMRELFPIELVDGKFELVSVSLDALLIFGNMSFVSIDVDEREW